MAKKLAKAQLGKIVKTAVKAVAKEAKPEVKAVKKPSFMDFRTTDTKNMMHDALEMQERARLKAHLQSLSKKQEGGPQQPSGKLPSAKELNQKATPVGKKGVAPDYSIFEKMHEKRKAAETSSPKYKIENYKPFKPTVAKKGGAVKTKKK